MSLRSFLFFFIIKAETKKLRDEEEAKWKILLCENKHRTEKKDWTEWRSLHLIKVAFIVLRYIN